MLGAVVFALPLVFAERLYEAGFPIWFFVSFFVLQAVYALWAVVSLWTCAFNSGRRIWGYVVRTAVCVFVLAVVVWMVVPKSTPYLQVLKLGNAQQAVHAPNAGMG